MQSRMQFDVCPNHSLKSYESFSATPTSKQAKRIIWFGFHYALKMNFMPNECRRTSGPPYRNGRWERSPGSGAFCQPCILVVLLFEHQNAISCSARKTGGALSWQKCNSNLSDAFSNVKNNILSTTPIWPDDLSSTWQPAHVLFAMVWLIVLAHFAEHVCFTMLSNWRFKALEQFKCEHGISTWNVKFTFWASTYLLVINLHMNWV